MEPLIELWQQAKTDESRMDSRYQEGDVIPEIIKLDRKQQKLIKQKTLFSLILLSVLIVVFLNRESFSTYSLLGIGIFIFSIIFILLLLNKLRFIITNEELSLPTIQLADIAARKIRTEKKIFTTYLPVFVIVAMVGFNLMNLDFFVQEETGTRILYHFILTGSALLAFFIGLSVRIKRFKKQFLPLLDLIHKFKTEATYQNTH